jgi:NAD(P)-dependent dehydrogenase (short-subunit alcohol dehydrogenase family)
VNDKVAIITAGGSGMGAAVARRLAADGIRVSILSSSGKGEALANELGGFGVTGSNQSSDDLKRFVDGTVARWGRVDVLVNSAGHGPRAPLLEITDDQWRAGMDVYFMNVVRAVRLVGPLMKAQGGGAIINISTAGLSSRAQGSQLRRCSGLGSRPTPRFSPTLTHPTTCA